MARRVWKFPLTIDGQIHQIHATGTSSFLQPLSVGIDPKGQLCLWGLVETAGANPPGTGFLYQVVGTGTCDQIAPSLKFLGTVNVRSLMFHVFATTFIESKE